MESEKPITSAGKRFVILWSAAVLTIFIFLGIFSVSTVNKYREEAAARHEARINPHAVEPGKTAAEDKLPEGANPRKVTVGIYMDGISEISILDSTWSPVFYIWFKWTDTDVNPGETFRIVDGEILSKVKELERFENGEHYAQYLVRAKLTKFFTSDRFPLDDHLLTLSIEDSERSWEELEFVPDNDFSNLSSRVKMPGYSVYKFGLVMKPHTYKTSFGIPGVPKDKHETFSQLIYGIWNIRPGLGPYFKTFLGLFAAILIALLALFIKPTHVDPRFGLGIGGFFGAVANMILSVSMVPESGVMTLMNLVNSVGVVAIAISMIQSTISLHIFDSRGEEALSRLYDRVSFVVICTCFVVINILIPLAAWAR